MLLYFYTYFQVFCFVFEKKTFFSSVYKLIKKTILITMSATFILYTNLMKCLCVDSSCSYMPTRVIYIMCCSHCKERLTLQREAHVAKRCLRYPHAHELFALKFPSRRPTDTEPTRVIYIDPKIDPEIDPNIDPKIVPKSTPKWIPKSFQTSSQNI